MINRNLENLLADMIEQPAMAEFILALYETGCVCGRYDVPLPPSGDAPR